MFRKNGTISKWLLSLAKSSTGFFPGEQRSTRASLGPVRKKRLVEVDRSRAGEGRKKLHLSFFRSGAADEEEARKSAEHRGQRETSKQKGSESLFRDFTVIAKRRYNGRVEDGGVTDRGDQKSKVPSVPGLGGGCQTEGTYASNQRIRSGIVEGKLAEYAMHIDQQKEKKNNSIQPRAPL